MRDSPLTRTRGRPLAAEHGHRWFDQPVIALALLAAVIIILMLV
jgi:hypothetical protein